MHKGSLLGNQRYAPIHEINGYRVKPGKYLRNGATIVEGGVNFTIHSMVQHPAIYVCFTGMKMNRLQSCRFQKHTALETCIQWWFMGLTQRNLNMHINLMANMMCTRA